MFGLLKCSNSWSVRLHLSILFWSDIKNSRKDFLFERSRVLCRARSPVSTAQKKIYLAYFGSSLCFPFSSLLPLKNLWIRSQFNFGLFTLMQIPRSVLKSIPGAAAELLAHFCFPVQGFVFCDVNYVFSLPHVHIYIHMERMCALYPGFSNLKRITCEQWMDTGHVQCVSLAGWGVTVLHWALS